MGTETYEYTSQWHVIREDEISESGERDTSIERIASASVLVKEKEMSDKSCAMKS